MTASPSGGHTSPQRDTNPLLTRGGGSVATGLSAMLTKKNVRNGGIGLVLLVLLVLLNYSGWLAIRIDNTAPALLATVRTSMENEGWVRCVHQTKYPEEEWNKTPLDPGPLVVIMPFYTAEFYKKKEQWIHHIRSWPDMGVHSGVTFVFFVDGLETQSARREMEESLVGSLPEGMRNHAMVHFRGHETLSKEVSTNRVLLEGMEFVRTQLHGRYMFQMEFDVTPLKEGWLAKLIDATKVMANQGIWLYGAARYYMPGSRFRLVAEIMNQNLWHINGNALYDAGDPCFEMFIRRAFEHYWSKNPSTDMCIWTYLEDPRFLVAMRDVRHRFGYLGAIANMGSREFTRESLPHRAFLVHGKNMK